MGALDARRRLRDRYGHGPGGFPPIPRGGMGLGGLIRVGGGAAAGAAGAALLPYFLKEGLSAIGGGGGVKMPHMPGLPTPVEFNIGVVPTGPTIQPVKMWQAGAALFAIDSEGRRWSYSYKLGIWKRTKVYRNIVISTKDIYRARRLVRTSRRLQALRHSLASYGKKGR